MPVVLVLSDGIRACSRLTSSPTQELFKAERSTYHGVSTPLAPVKVPVNGPVGEAVETRTDGAGPVKLPRSSCSGNAPSVY